MRPLQRRRPVPAQSSRAAGTVGPRPSPHGCGYGRRDRHAGRLLALLLPGLVAACGGEQSSLNAAGAEARHVAVLFWAMAIGGGLIWTGVLGAFLFAARADRRAWSQHAAGRLILWAGVAFPVLALAALLTYALWLMPSLRPWTVAEPTKLSIEVTARQYWWEVRYRQAGGDGRRVGQRGSRAGRRAGRVRARQPRRHPFLLDPAARRQDGHDPGADEPPLAAGRSGGHVPRAMRRVLRRLPRPDGVHRPGDARGGVSAMARGCAPSGRGRPPTRAGDLRERTAAAPAMPFAAPRRAGRSDRTSRISAAVAASAPASCR